MPYSKWSDVNPAIRGIKPRVTLAQANTIAGWADSIEKKGDGPESPWAVAIAQFKKSYTVKGSKWVKRKQKEVAEMAGFQIAQTAVETALAFVNGAPEIRAVAAEKGVTPEQLANTMLQKLQREIAEADSSDEEAELVEAVWTAKHVNDLPDSSFALIESGGEKDEEGKTKPRSLRHLPYKDASGKVDLPHLRNARARIKHLKGISAALIAKAQRKLDAAAKKHLKTHQEEVEMGIRAAIHAELSEIDGSLEDIAYAIREAFTAAFRRTVIDAEGYRRSTGPWPRDVFAEHPELGDAVIAREDDGKLYAVTYTEGDDGYEFADRDDWVEVRLTYVAVTGAGKTKENSADEGEADAGAEDAVVELKESASGNVLELVELGEAAVQSNARKHLTMHMRLIKPGWGNKKDGHYYPTKTLKESAGVFEGAKMYATDHKQDEKSVRTEVSVVDRIAYFEGDGSPVAQVTVFDPGFAEQIRNRAAAGKLDTLECSILATGKARKGKVDGKKAKIVEAITEAHSVDWVTKAGAGGRAVALVEAEAGAGGDDMEGDVKIDGALEEVEVAEDEDKNEGQKTTPAEQAPKVLATETVAEALSGSRLPKASQVRLVEAKYADEAALTEAIKAEKVYVSEIAGAGKPFGGSGSGGGGGEKKPTFEEIEEQAKTDADAVFSKYGLKV